MLRHHLAGYGLLIHSAVCSAAADVFKTGPKAAQAGAALNWSLSLIVVLAAFFLCIWALRKLNRVTPASSGQMRVISGLALGSKEKIMLVQVGKSQLVLGLTPGRIQTLHVIAGDDKALDVDEPSDKADNSFAAKLIHTLKRSNHDSM
jgi:flagellar protein FliO/FliZ